MKRYAQRKFAQGVQLPPISGSTLLEKNIKNEINDVDNNPKVTLKRNLKSKQIVDRLSYNAHHKHYNMETQVLKVVLEKIDYKPEEKKLKIATPENTPTNTPPKPPANTTPNSCSMSLRSKEKTNSDTNSNTDAKQQVREGRLSFDFSSEDERPLGQIKQNGKRGYSKQHALEQLKPPDTETPESSNLTEQNKETPTDSNTERPKRSCRAKREDAEANVNSQRRNRSRKRTVSQVLKTDKTMKRKKNLKAQSEIKTKKGRPSKRKDKQSSCNSSRELTSSAVEEKASLQKRKSDPDKTVPCTTTDRQNDTTTDRQNDTTTDRRNDTTTDRRNDKTVPCTTTDRRNDTTTDRWNDKEAVQDRSESPTQDEEDKVKVRTRSKVRGGLQEATKCTVSAKNDMPSASTYIKPAMDMPSTSTYRQPHMDMPSTSTYRQPHMDMPSTSTYRQPHMDMPSTSTYRQPDMDMPSTSTYRQPDTDIPSTSTYRLSVMGTETDVSEVNVQDEDRVRTRSTARLEEARPYRMAYINNKMVFIKPGSDIETSDSANQSPNQSRDEELRPTDTYINEADSLLCKTETVVESKTQTEASRAQDSSAAALELAQKSQPGTSRAQPEKSSNFYSSIDQWVLDGMIFGPSTSTTANSDIYEFSDIDPPVSQQYKRRQTQTTPKKDVFVRLNESVAIKANYNRGSRHRVMSVDLVPISTVDPESIIDEIPSDDSVAEVIDADYESSSSEDFKVDPAEQPSTNGETPRTCPSQRKEAQSKRSKKQSGNEKNVLLSTSPTLVAAPVFYPTEEEWTSPIEYIDKIRNEGEKFGICKIVPPSSFKSECIIPDDTAFTVDNQYINRTFRRWGSASREMGAINFKLMSSEVPGGLKVPLIEGLEANLPLFSKAINDYGIVEGTVEKTKLFSTVLEKMNIKPTKRLIDKMENIFIEILVPYQSITHTDRIELFKQVDSEWEKKQQRLKERARSPLTKQKAILNDTLSDSEGEDNSALVVQECVTRGRAMKLGYFKKVAENALSRFFPDNPNPSPVEVEKAYWRIVMRGNDHVCVYSAFVDTGGKSLGFPNAKSKSAIGKHPWNLKNLNDDSHSVLRSLGKILTVTVPTIHVGMMFSTHLWYRDPQGLPWVEYHHQGAPKVWYGISEHQGKQFRKAVEKVSPISCQNKKIWLPSDTTMIPPEVLLEQDVKLSQTIQKPGEFVIVFSKAYTSSICTGFTLSESVCFASMHWLYSAPQNFRELAESCEPPMFCIEQLLLAIATDKKVGSKTLLQQSYIELKVIVDEELSNRKVIKKMGIEQKRTVPPAPRGIWHVREHSMDCDVCHSILYLSRIMNLGEKKNKFCLNHGIQIIEATKDKNHSSALMEIDFTTEHLMKILTDLEEKLEMGQNLAVE